MTGIVLSKDSHGDSVKNTGDEGLQKLGQEARSQAPSFSYKLDEKHNKMAQEWSKKQQKKHLIDLMKTDEEFGMYIGKEYQSEFQGFDLTKSFIEREETLYRKYYLICEGYKLPEVSGRRMARKV